MRLVAVLLTLLAVATCQTDSQVEWSEWEDIGPEQSLIGVTVPSGANARDIQRRQREDINQYAVQESWRWSGGEAWLVRLPPNYAWRFEPNSPRVVTDEYEKWKWLKDAGVEIARADVRQRNNGIGNYYYAIAETESGDRFCFVAAQGIAPRVGPDYESQPGSAGGIVSMYRCVPQGRVDKEAVVNDMVAVMDSMQLR